MEKKEFETWEVDQIVDEALRDPKNIIKMIQKYGEHAIQNIHDGKIHLDFDDREGTSYNNDLLKLMPFNLKYPFSITSWKGTVYVHCLDIESINCSGWSTTDILSTIVSEYSE